MVANEIFLLLPKCHRWLYYAVCDNRRMYEDIRQERECAVANEVFLLLPKCHKWLYYAVCGNRRMYAVIRQEREYTVANEVFLLLPKCHKWLCYAVCSNRRMYAVIRQKWECTVSCCCRSVINGFVMRFVAIGECSRFTAGTGMCGCKRGFPAVAEVSQTALLCGLLGFIKNGRCGEIPPLP